MSNPELGGREASFTRFVQDASPSLARTAWLLTGDRHLAAELVQSALVKTYLAWRRVRPAEAAAYERRTLVNANTDRLRRRHGEVVGLVVDLPAASPGESVVDDRDQIVRMLAALPMQQRKIVVLRYLEDLSEADTAGLLGIFVGTVKSAASRGLASLRAQYATVDAAREGSQA